MKKKDGDLRFCSDYRCLNAVTKRDSCQLPRINDVFSLTRLKTLFYDALTCSLVIFKSKCHPKATAFTTPHGLHKWVVIPNQWSGYIWRFLERLFFGILGHYSFVYVDDVLEASDTWPDHLKHLDETTKAAPRPTKAWTRLKAQKCHIAASEVHYLGHVLSSSSIRMGESKCACIRNYPVPESKQEVRLFFGLTSYYRKFVKGFPKFFEVLANLTTGICEFLLGLSSKWWFRVSKESVDGWCNVKVSWFVSSKRRRTPFYNRNGCVPPWHRWRFEPSEWLRSHRPIYFVPRKCNSVEKNYGARSLDREVCCW